MGKTVFDVTWNSFAAWRIENNFFSMLVVPALGGKIVSLIDKRDQYQWLLMPQRKIVSPPQYGQSFRSFGLFGWDEMFPTINPCHYPLEGKYQGVEMPDHGEVWALPWNTTTVADNHVEMQITGRALPYQLKRTIKTTRASKQILFQYEVHNTGDEELTFLWAPHPQFLCSTDIRIVLPDQVTEVINVKENLEQWGQVGRKYAWPLADLSTGEQIFLDKIRPPKTNSCRKHYLTPDMRINWVELHRSKVGLGMGLQWHADELPYFGLWVDEGRYAFSSVATPEPTQAFFDNLEEAYERAAAPILQPGAMARWSLIVEAISIAK